MNSNARPPIHQVEITEKSLAIFGSYITELHVPARRSGSLESGPARLVEPMISAVLPLARASRRRSSCCARAARRRWSSRHDPMRPAEARKAARATQPVASPAPLLLRRRRGRSPTTPGCPGRTRCSTGWSSSATSGTELGPPGYLGDGRRRPRAARRVAGLALVGAFLPQHFSRARRGRRGPRLAAPSRCASCARPRRRAPVRSPCWPRRIDEPERLALHRSDRPASRGAARRRSAGTRSWTTCIAAARAVPARRASSRSSTRTRAPTSRPPTRSTALMATRSTRRSWGSAWTPGHFRYGGADPGPGASATTPRSCGTCTSRTADPQRPARCRGARGRTSPRRSTTASSAALGDGRCGHRRGRRRAPRDRLRGLAGHRAGPVPRPPRTRASRSSPAREPIARHLARLGRAERARGPARRQARWRATQLVDGGPIDAGGIVQRAPPTRRRRW